MTRFTRDTGIEQAMIEAKEAIEELPPRTLKRSLSSIFGSARPASVLIGEAVLQLALGTRIEWEYQEITKLITDLANSETTLGDWFDNIQSEVKWHDPDTRH